VIIIKIEDKRYTSCVRSLIYDTKTVRMRLVSFIHLQHYFASRQNISVICPCCPLGLGSVMLLEVCL